MKARMKDNIIELYENALPGELEACEKQYGSKHKDSTVEFLKSIQGKTVDLVFTCGDAFEKNDNNVWLPNSLWEQV